MYRAAARSHECCGHNLFRDNDFFLVQSDRLLKRGKEVCASWSGGVEKSVICGVVWCVGVVEGISSN